MSKGVGIHLTPRVQTLGIPAPSLIFYSLTIGKPIDTGHDRRT